MKLAVLFWFYKEPELCENRLVVLRRRNPHAKVYGLYGGDPAKAPLFRERLGQYLDDFYVFDQPRDAHWKWYHGDQMIVHWYRKRGVDLAWDSLFIAQWDMLVFGRLEGLFAGVQEGEMLFSGLRPVREVDPWWWYIREGSPERAEYFRFVDFVRQTHGFSAEPLCGEFIVVCLPRSFLERYAGIHNPDLGFLEYKIPIYAQIFGVPFCTAHPYNPWWGDDPSTRDAPLLARALNSETRDVPLRSILTHLALPWGSRIFHPVFREYPLDFRRRMGRLGEELRDEVLKPGWWRFNRRYLGKP
ncbi:hypothetical protein U5817_20395 [Aromatoleum evansii]|uniref:Uncharacterized protein n=1 Tax=Aromatoleum evansii TaxID=59406 RepID=A0ABZ1AI47_AROEV|nr:hypothetical protein U5817_20395 [Aromatoleum evansii]